MSRKKALIASSLTVCSASTTLAIGSQQDAHAYVEDPLSQTQSRLDQETDGKQSLFHYLKPVSVNTVSGQAKEWHREKPEQLTYEVKKGDNLYRIGLYYGVHHDQLAAMNDITDPRKLQIGHRLKLPIQPKWVRATGKETVERLAKKYDSTTVLITDLNPFFKKKLVPEKGQWILVPTKLKVSKPNSAVLKQLTPQKKNKVVKFADSPAKQTHHWFQWPVQGQITSKFGWRHGRPHKGIDIWNAARSKAHIYASRSGTVIRAGYSSGYGNLVVIDHGNGYETYYAHLSRIHVGKGQQVTSGEIIGNMGQTGNATGYHLHFEIRKNGEALNPLSILD